MAHNNNRTSSDQVVNDPSSQLFSSLADFYRENGLYAEAIEICLTGLEAGPDNLEGRMVLAKCYLATREFAKSREQITKILTSQQENSAAKRLLAEVDREEKMPPAEAPHFAAPPQPASPAAMPAPQPTPRPSPLDQARDKPGQAPPEAPPTRPAATTFPALLAEVLAEPEPRLISAQAPRLSSAQAPRPISAQQPPAEPAPQPVPERIAASQQPAPQATIPTSQLQLAPQEIPAAPTPAAVERPQPVAEPTPAAAERPAERGLQLNYNKILQDLVQTPQVLGSLLMDESGFVVASAFDNKAQGSVDEESSGALAVSIFGTGKEAMKKIRMGELERLVIDTSTEKIFLNRAGPMLLLVSAETSAKVGLVAVNTRQAVDRIKGMGPK